MHNQWHKSPQCHFQESALKIRSDTGSSLILSDQVWSYSVDIFKKKGTCESRKENPQKPTQLSSRSHPRHLVGKRTAQKTPS